NMNRPSVTAPGGPQMATLEAFRAQHREQQLAFQMAANLTRLYVAQPTCEVPAHVLFPQVLRIVQRYLNDKVKVRPPAERLDAFLSPYYGWIIERRVGAWILKEISYINVLAHSPCFYKSSVINHLRYPCTNATPAASGRRASTSPPSASPWSARVRRRCRRSRKSPSRPSTSPSFSGRPTTACRRATARWTPTSCGGARPTTTTSSSASASPSSGRSTTSFRSRCWKPRRRNASTNSTACGTRAASPS